jgi:hypothetical protein
VRVVVGMEIGEWKRVGWTMEEKNNTQGEEERRREREAGREV